MLNDTISNIDVLIIDQISSSIATVADYLGLPFVTVCNAMLITVHALQILQQDKQLDPLMVHPAATACACSNALGCCSNRASRGWTAGGASRAATNASHCSGSNWKL